MTFSNLALDEGTRKPNALALVFYLIEMVPIAFVCVDFLSKRRWKSTKSK